MDDSNALLAARKEKIDEIRAIGIPLYPNDFKVSHTVEELKKLIEENSDGLGVEGPRFSVAGRMMAVNKFGKSSFIRFKDRTGQIQAYVQNNKVGGEVYDLFKKLDIGDFVGISGTLFQTRTGEWTLLAETFRLLSKSMRPLPEKFHGIKDPEKRYRQRYLDLIMNKEARDIFIRRSKTIGLMRSFLEQRDFMEVETPMMQPVPGGAEATPFKTWHNALGMELFLRIAPELYLKRLIVGGFERVYEIGKNFRNEGMDRTHNPEFTLMEFYEAYSDLNGMMDIAEDLFKHLANTVIGKEKFIYQGHEVNLGGTWRRASMPALVQEYTGLDVDNADFDEIKAFCVSKHIEIPAGAGKGKLIAELYEHYVEEKLIQPTFVCDFPKEISPLAKAKPGNPLLADRFELIIAGSEFANAFSELNDPMDQRSRLEAQAALRAMGDDEANVVDEDFLEALEYGMPPMGGQGIGIDRLVMLLTGNDSIKEVILFPQMKGV